ncbi:unnamed protein product [Sphenostylis stenocarpa]|uniref:Uncharacterized protein n=1 Tax=Sphenostylis stenocarpa TaxID=92480 RepID=A0AA86VWJ6_9FABA|nr:unnamed protein product [Sphenostylis stenocarpa]
MLRENGSSPNGIWDMRMVYDQKRMIIGLHKRMNVTLFLVCNLVTNPSSALICPNINGVGRMRCESRIWPHYGAV